MLFLFEESLRKYPPFPFVTRTCVMDYKVPNSDVIIQKGRRVVVPILALHLDKEYWPDPQKFDPERFSDDNKPLIQQYSYIPFGEGPRYCIGTYFIVYLLFTKKILLGMRFGLTQTKVGLVALLRDYKFSVNPRTLDPLKMAVNSFILNAEGGIWLDSQKLLKNNHRKQ